MRKMLFCLALAGFSVGFIGCGETTTTTPTGVTENKDGTLTPPAPPKIPPIPKTKPPG
jgi:hypothetical protein